MATIDNKSTVQLDLALQEKVRDLVEKQEELDAQRGMLTFAIDELAEQNKNLERALMQVREGNAELRQLLYQSSHGLRSPLTSIQGILNLFEMEPLSEELLEYKQHMDYKISSMLEILNSLTTLSTLVNNDVNLAPINIHAIVSECLRYCSQLALTKEINIEVSSGITHQTIRSDAALLLAILKQVVMNAIIFRDAGKQGYVAINTTISDKTLVILVEDDGEGVAPEIGNNIFNMFVRGSGKSGGSGLGLFIAKKAVDLLGGVIEFTRSDGKTVFRVLIPVTDIKPE